MQRRVVLGEGSGRGLGAKRCLALLRLKYLGERLKLESSEFVSNKGRGMQLSRRNTTSQAQWSTGEGCSSWVEVTMQSSIALCDNPLRLSRSMGVLRRRTRRWSRTAQWRGMASAQIGLLLSYLIS